MGKTIAFQGLKDRLLKISDVQEYCSISRSRAYKLLDEGLSYVRLGEGGAIRVRQSALEQFLADREQST